MKSQIDFVIIWVDGSDPAWQKERAKYTAQNHNPDGDTEIRYRDWNNLQYWFRGVERFAPWVDTVHFVTWGHLPPWLNVNHPKLHIVRHEDYIPSQYLPTFNSHTIELNLHRIEGLSEQFVYFNDDIFLTAPTASTDFFKNGLPCDTFGINPVYFVKDSAGFYNGANMEVINTFFRDKRHAMRRDFGKWFNPKNGLKNLTRTSLLLAWPWYPGFYYDHLASNFLKSTFEAVWNKCGETLDLTCQDKFRQRTNVNQWLFKYWQLAEGKYTVRTAKYGQCFHVDDENFEEVCCAVRTGRYNMICINDTARTTDFENKRKKVIEAFEKLLPQPSMFERKNS